MPQHSVNRLSTKNLFILVEIIDYYCMKKVKIVNKYFHILIEKCDLCIRRCVIKSVEIQLSKQLLK